MRYFISAHALSSCNQQFISESNSLRSASSRQLVNYSSFSSFYFLCPHPLWFLFFIVFSAPPAWSTALLLSVNRVIPFYMNKLAMPEEPLKDENIPQHPVMGVVRCGNPFSFSLFNCLTLTCSASPRTYKVSLLTLIIIAVSCYFMPTSTPWFSPAPAFNLRSQAIISKNPAIIPPVMMLSSRLDFWGFHSTIEFPDAIGFNPSMLSLPWRGEDNLHPNFIVVAREEDQLINVYGRDVRPRSILASLLHVPEFHPSTQDRTPPRTPAVLKAPWVTRLSKVVRSDDIHYPKCDPLNEWLHGLQGPEDARIFWSSLGEPLLIYNSISPDNSDLCRVMYLSDLRTAFPNVRNILSETTDPARIRFKEPVPLILPDQEGTQKNWAPFTAPNGDVFFHITLIPQHIYKLALTNPIPTVSSPGSDLRHFLEPVVTHARGKSNCLSVALPRQKVHQTSPFLDVILCTSTDVRSGSCNPDDPRNHLYMGIINVVHNHLDPYFYEGRILTLNYLSPFNYVSLSKPIGYSTHPLSHQTPALQKYYYFLLILLVGLDQSKLIYSVSMTFRRKQTSGRGLATGYLDDFLVISFGIQDKTSHFVEVTVGEALENHDLCSDVMSGNITLEVPEGIVL